MSKRKITAEQARLLLGKLGDVRDALIIFDLMHRMKMPIGSNPVFEGLQEIAAALGLELVERHPVEHQRPDPSTPFRKG